MEVGEYIGGTAVVAKKKVNVFIFETKLTREKGVGLRGAWYKEALFSNAALLFGRPLGICRLAGWAVGKW